MSELNKQRNYGLDLLRCLAILSVLLLHASQIVHDMPPLLKTIFAYGWSGVDLFFVLSGFLIGRQVFSESRETPVTESLKKFWIKRWFRTFPLYYFVLFIYVVVKPLLGFPFNGWNAGFLFFFQNYMSPQDFVQSWSLCIEEQFYLLFPLLAFVCYLRFKSPLVWLMPLFFSLTYRFWMWHNGAFDEANEIIISNIVRFPFHTHLDGISAGVFLAATYPFWKELKDQHRRLLGLFGVGLLLITFYFSGPETLHFAAVYTYALISIAFSFLLIALYRIQIPKSIFGPIQKISLWSYGLYLWNNLVMRLLEKMNLPLPWWMNTAIFFLLSALISFLTYHLIEEFFLRMRDRLLLRLFK